jgi:predicted nucleic acid-binding protein
MPNQGFSHTGCLSFAVMREMGLAHAFTDDHYSAILGFGLEP